jgi:hypothetical protein
MSTVLEEVLMSPDLAMEAAECSFKSPPRPPAAELSVISLPAMDNVGPWGLIVAAERTSTSPDVPVLDVPVKMAKEPESPLTLEPVETPTGPLP